MSRFLGELWLLGAGAVAFVLFAASLVGVPWGAWAVVVGTAGVIGLGLWLGRGLRMAWPHPIDAVSVLAAAGYARYATLAPTPEVDFIMFWGMKAKQYAFARGIDWAFLQNPFNAFAHVDYPPLVTLLYDAQALLAGGWPGRWLGIVNAGFGVATLLLLRWFLAEETETPWLRALATLAFIAAAFSPWIGLAEGPLVAYGTAGLLFVRRGDVARGAVYLGLAANCKNEGLTLIVAAAAGLIAAGAWRSVVRLWPAVAVAAPWVVARSLHGLHGDLMTPGVAARAAAHLHDLGPMLAAMLQYSFGRPVLWAGVVAALILGAPRIARRERFLAVAIVVQLAFFIAAYVVTPHDLTWHVHWSWERLVVQLGATIVFLAMVCVLPVVEETIRPRPAG